MMRAPLITSVALALAIATPGHAGGCGDVITIGTGEAGSTTLYIDDRSGTPSEINHWFYLESNGVDNLQTGGPSVLFPPGLSMFDDSDPCVTHGPEGPDTLLL